MDPKLSPSDAVLVIGDLQAGIVNYPLTVPKEELLLSARLLAKLAELYDIPTIAMTIPKRDGTNPTIIPEITETRTKFTHIQRTTPDSFETAQIADAIKATGRKTMIICGVATEIVVQWLGLSGRANGYDVHLIVDACAGLGVRSEQAALRRMEAAGVTMSSLVSLAGEFSFDFSKPQGRAAINLVYEMMGV